MSGMRKFQQTGGGPISLSDLDRALRSLSSLDKLTVAPPLELVRHGNATHLRTLPVAAGTSGGGTEIVRITGQFVKDTNPPVASPSPLCYYPGVVQKLDSSGWTDTATTVWVVFWYTEAIFDNGAAPWTVVSVDGTAAEDARDMGFSYAPDDGGVTPHSGENRPVYGSTGRGTGWKTQCVGGETQLSLIG